MINRCKVKPFKVEKFNRHAATAYAAKLYIL